MLLLQRSQGRIKIALALVLVAILSTACFEVNQQDGEVNINYLCDGGIVCGQYTMHSGLSLDLAWTIYASHCHYDNYCTAQTAWGHTNDPIFHEALADYNTMGNALYALIWTCPGALACNGLYGNEWKTRCLTFQIADSLSVDNVLTWNLLNSYYVRGSWNWYRAGNGGCTQ